MPSVNLPAMYGWPIQLRTGFLVPHSARNTFGQSRDRTHLGRVVRFRPRVLRAYAVVHPAHGVAGRDTRAQAPHGRLPRARALGGAFGRRRTGRARGLDPTHARADPCVFSRTIFSTGSAIAVWRTRRVLKPALVRESVTIKLTRQVSLAIRATVRAYVVGLGHTCTWSPRPSVLNVGDTLEFEAGRFRGRERRSGGRQIGRPELLVLDARPADAGAHLGAAFAFRIEPFVSCVEPPRWSHGWRRAGFLRWRATGPKRGRFGRMLGRCRCRRRWRLCWARGRWRPGWAKCRW